MQKVDSLIDAGRRIERGCTGFNNSKEFFDFLGQSLHSELKELAARGKKIVILLPFPSYPVSIPDYLNKKLMFGQEPTLRLTRQEHLQRVTKFANVWQAGAAAVNATVIDPSEALCALGECVYRRGPLALYIDGGHFGADAAESMRPLLLKALLDNRNLRSERNASDAGSISPTA
jgi:hypothetical protein